MNNIALRAEIAAHPAATDVDMVALLRQSETVWLDVTVGAVEGLCREGAIISRLEDYVAAAQAPSMARTVAKEFLGMLAGKMENVTMSNAGKRASVQAMLGALLAVGWVAADEVAAILALAQEQRSRAAVIGCPEIDQMDDASAALSVAAAREVA